MEELQLFNFEGNKVRTIKIKDEIYFVGKDVAKILGYARLQKAMNDHVDPEDKTELIVNISQSSQNRTKPEMTLLITESGVYSLIFNSKMPNAKRFKRWVTSEVLPAIRKHGAYMTDQKAFDVVHNKNGLADLLQQAADRLNSKDVQIEELEAKKKQLLNL
jgi:anti-repressor protein